MIVTENNLDAEIDIRIVKVSKDFGALCNFVYVIIYICTDQVACIPGLCAVDSCTCMVVNVGQLQVCIITCGD